MFYNDQRYLALIEKFKSMSMGLEQAQCAAQKFICYFPDEWIDVYLATGPQISYEEYKEVEGNLKILIMSKHPEISETAYNDLYKLTQTKNTTAVGPGELLTIIFCKCRFSKKGEKGDLIWLDTNMSTEVKSNGGRCAGQKSNESIDTKALCDIVPSFCQPYAEKKLSKTSFGGFEKYGPVALNIYNEGRLSELFTIVYNTLLKKDVNKEWLNLSLDLIKNCKRTEEVQLKTKTKVKAVTNSVAKLWAVPMIFCIGVAQTYEYIMNEGPDTFNMQDGVCKSLLIEREGLTYAKLFKQLYGKVYFTGQISRSGSQDRAFQMKFITDKTILKIMA